MIHNCFIPPPVDLSNSGIMESLDRLRIPRRISSEEAQEEVQEVQWISSRRVSRSLLYSLGKL